MANLPKPSRVLTSAFWDGTFNSTDRPAVVVGLTPLLPLLVKHHANEGKYRDKDYRESFKDLSLGN